MANETTPDETTALAVSPVLSKKSASILARARGNAASAVGDGGFLKIIMDLLKGLLGGFLGGICGPQTPAAVFEQLVRPTWRQENVQERTLERDTRRLERRGVIKASEAVALEMAVIEEARATESVEETAAMLAEAKVR